MMPTEHLLHGLGATARTRVAVGFAADANIDDVRSTAKARARVVEALLTEVDVPPPARLRQDQSLDRHISSRYLPCQIPFASLSCAELLSAQDVSELCRVFERYNVLPNRDDGALPNGWDPTKEPAETQKEAPAAPAGRRPSKKNQTVLLTRSAMRALQKKRSPPLPDERRGSVKSARPIFPIPGSDGVTAGPCGGTSTSHEPLPVPHVNAPRKKKKLRVGSGMGLSVGQLSREEDDRAITKEWVVELLLDGIASKLNDALLAHTLHPSRHGPSTLVPTSLNSNLPTSDHRSGCYLSTLPALQPLTPPLNSPVGSQVPLTPRSTTDTASSNVGGPLEESTKAQIPTEFTGIYNVTRGVVGAKTQGSEDATMLTGASGGARLSASYHESIASAMARGGVVDAARSRRRQVKEAMLGHYKSELMQWLEPLTQPCHSHQHADVWELCEMQVKRLQIFHEIMRGEPSEPGVGGSHYGGSVVVDGQTITRPRQRISWSRASDVDSIANYGPGCCSSVLDATMAPKTSDMCGGTTTVQQLVDSTTNEQLRSRRAIAECNPSLKLYGEQHDGKPLPTWATVLAHPEPWTALLQDFEAEEAAAATGRRPRRPLEDDHGLIFWSDFTNNIIMSTASTAVSQLEQDREYRRVPMMMLGEDDPHPKDLAPAGASTGSREDEEEEEDQPTTMGVLGNSRRRRRRAEGSMGDRSTVAASTVADLETFVDELKGLHTQSADRVLASRVHGCIVTSSKGSVVKLWDSKAGRFMWNLLNLGNSWVLDMHLLHDDQYLFVATSNSELTIVEFPAGVMVQKFRGCTTLVTALTKVIQPATNHIQRFGIKLGECGPHRLQFKEDMSPDVYQTLRKQAQLSHIEMQYPAKPIEGFVQPTAFCLNVENGMCVFGTEEGAVGCFDLSFDIRRSTILSGANMRPIQVSHIIQAHDPGVRVMGICYCMYTHCVMSCGQDGSVTRVPVILAPAVSEQQRLTPPLTAVPPISFGRHSTFVVPRRPIRMSYHCSAARLFVTVHSDRRVLLWNIGRNTTDLVHQLPQETEDIVGVAFRSEEQLVATLTADLCIRIYDFRGFRPRNVIPLTKNHDSNSMEDMATVTIKCSVEDADGCLMFFPGMQRIVCALRGPVMYDSYVPTQATGARSLSKTKVSPSTDDEDEGRNTREKGGYSSSGSLPVTHGERQLGGCMSPPLGLDAVGSDDGHHGRRSKRVAHRKRTSEARRLQRNVTQQRTVVSVVVNRSSLELHTFAGDRWRIWDVLSGTLKKEMNVPRLLGEQQPKFRRTVLTSAGWTTEANTRILAGARGGNVVTLDAAAGVVVHAEALIQESRVNRDLIDTDVHVVVNHGTRTFICGGRTCCVRRYMPNVVHVNGVEDFNAMSVRLPASTTITSCCVIRDTHFCVGTSDTRLFFFRMVEGSAPYYEEVLRDADGGDLEVGAVVGIFFLNDYNQNLILIVVDTGVIQVLSYLTNRILARFRAFPRHECRIRQAIHHRPSNWLLYGDTRGRVRVLDVSGFSAASIDFRRTVRVRYDFQGACEEITALDAFPYTPRSPPAPMPAAVLPTAGSDAAPTSAVEGSLQSPQPPRPSFFAAAPSGTARPPTQPSTSPLVYVVVGAADGCVRLFQMPEDSPTPGDRTTPGAVSVVSQSSLAGQVVTVADALPQRHRHSLYLSQPSQHPRAAVPVGLFGLDTWQLDNTATYPAGPISVSAMPSYLLTQNEEFLNTILQQAKAAEQQQMQQQGAGVSAGGGGMAFALSGAADNGAPAEVKLQPVPSHLSSNVADGEVAEGPFTSTRTKSLQNTVDSRVPLYTADHPGSAGRPSKVRAESRTGTAVLLGKSFQEHSVPEKGAIPPQGANTAAKTDTARFSRGSRNRPQLRKVSPSTSAAEAPAVPPTKEELFQAQTVCAHTIDTLLPHSCGQTNFSPRTTSTMIAGNTVNSDPMDVMLHRQSGMENSRGPQRRLTYLKFHRNPLIRTYPVAWLKKIMVLHPLSPLPLSDENDTPALISADEAFGTDANQHLVLPIIATGRGQTLESPNRDAFAAGEVQCAASPTVNGIVEYSSNTSSLVINSRSTTYVPHSHNTSGADPSPAFMTDVQPATRGGAGSLAPHSNVGAQPLVCSGDGYSAPNNVVTTPVGCPNNSHTSPNNCVTLSGEEGNAEYSQPRSGRGLSNQTHPVLQSNRPSFVSPDSVTLLHPDKSYGRSFSEEPPSSGVSNGSHHSSVPTLLQQPRLSSTHAAVRSFEQSLCERRRVEALEKVLSSLDDEVVDQRYDQLMLTHLAKQLDRVEPTGYEPSTFTRKIKDGWLKRTGDAAVLAATRAAALEAAGLAMHHGIDETGADRVNDLVLLHAKIEEKANEMANAPPEDRIGLDLSLMNLPTEVAMAPGNVKPQRRVSQDAARVTPRPASRGGDRSSSQERRSEGGGVGRPMILLSARERMHAQLLDLRRQRERKAVERRRREEANPNPRAWLPQVSVRHATHPVVVTLPSVLQDDEGAKAQLRALQRLTKLTDDDTVV